jgi:hypothetical protein
MMTSTVDIWTFVGAEVGHRVGFRRPRPQADAISYRCTTTLSALRRSDCAVRSSCGRRRRRPARGARRKGARRAAIIVMSRHDDRRLLARGFRATDIIEQRGDDGVARINDLTGGSGVHSVIEAVATREPMLRRSGRCALVATSATSVPPKATRPGDPLFFSHAHLHGCRTGGRRVSELCARRHATCVSVDIDRPTTRVHIRRLCSHRMPSQVTRAV